MLETSQRCLTYVQTFLQDVADACLSDASDDAVHWSLLVGALLYAAGADAALQAEDLAEGGVRTLIISPLLLQPPSPPPRANPHQDTPTHTTTHTL